MTAGPGRRAERPARGSEGSARALVFCYGSNMLVRRLRDRTPSAVPRGVATLTGHRLAFHKRGADGSGKADARATGSLGDRVHGVVFQIDVAELTDLDGFERGYARRWVRVSMSGTGPTRAYCYEALETHVEPRLRPFGWYRELVIMGAREHGLPSAYVRSLIEHPAVADLDRDRRNRWLRMLG